MTNQDQNDGTNPSALNLLSGSDMTGLALANAIEANNHTAGDETTAGGMLQGKNNITNDGAALIDLSET